MKKSYKFMMAAIFMIFSLQGFSLSVLLVNDNNYDISRIDVIKNAIGDAGYEFSYYDATVENGSPSFSLMKNFDLVIWYTGNDGTKLYFWNKSDTDNEEIKQYIDNGGMFWLMGLDFLFDRYGGAPYDFASGDMMYDYFGISQYVAQSYVDDGLFSSGVPELDVMDGNGIFTFSPIKWTYDFMWYVDALNPVADAVSVYRLGPEGYDFYDYMAGIYYEKGDAKVLTFTFETARIDTPENTAEVFKEGLDYFNQFGHGTIIHVTGIDVYGENGQTTITENGGTLQMHADVYPDSATNKAVFWSVTPGTAYASVTPEGLLKASGSDIGNGNVWVKATAADGSGIADSVEITISNQTSPPGFNILLVNDNNYTNRVFDIDTVLQMMDYDYTIYDIDSMGARPDLATLSKYELVMWYTGNDGVGLRLWDVSDTNDYKFNSDLIQYIDYGGYVWVQGLDFMYDVVGKAPDSFVPGQFIYDYMGISDYVGQSHVDDEGINLLELDAVDGNGVCTFSPVKWVYNDGLWYADAFDITPSAVAIYNMGPIGYPFYGKTCGLYNQLPGKGIVMSWAFETARIDSDQHTAEIFDEVFSWFKKLSAVPENKLPRGNVLNVYPNPSKENVNISYSLDVKSNVSFEMFDVTGKKVWEQNPGEQLSGQHTIVIERYKLGLPDGMYFYNLKINGKPLSGKVIFK